MAEFRMLPIAKIFVAEDRARKTDPGHVAFLKTEIETHGFMDPVLVRKTPRRAEAPYTLVDGADRLSALGLLKETEIPCMVVAADADTAEMLAAGANLFRHLTLLDRAIAIHRYRQAWERKHGKIKRGNPKLTNCEIISQLPGGDGPIDVIAHEAKAGFSAVCAERMGMTKRNVEISVRIATRLPQALIDRLRGTSIADTQVQLIALSKLPSDKLICAAEMFDIAEGDFDRMMAYLEAKKPKPDPRLKNFNAGVNSWVSSSSDEKWWLLESFGLLEQFDERMKAICETVIGAPRPKEDRKPKQ